MRVENWNPNVMDETFENVSVERLVEAANAVADAARRECPVGTKSRPIYLRGKYKGQNWTARDAGQLKRSIRVVTKQTLSGKPLWRKRNVRIYAGHYLAYYARIVEFNNPFMRRALYNSLSQVKSIIGVSNG
jgi:hypothetical protein